MQTGEGRCPTGGLDSQPGPRGQLRGQMAKPETKQNKTELQKQYFVIGPKDSPLVFVVHTER